MFRAVDLSTRCPASGSPLTIASLALSSTGDAVPPADFQFGVARGTMLDRQIVSAVRAEHDLLPLWQLSGAETARCTYGTVAT